MMEEYEKHIRLSGDLAWCGETIGPVEWAFVDVSHATASVHVGDRLLPCPKCAKLAGIEMS